jgi:Cdc6-like AAA superfamily ATPase
MSVQITRAVLKEFLGNAETTVLALTGAWGTGKTYVWHEALLAHKESIKFKHYSYVSLFGINSMAELRMSLFTKSIAVATLGSKLDFEAINEHWGSIASDWLKGQYARFGPMVRSLPHGGSVSLGLEALAPSAVRNSLVCLDDFERQTRCCTRRPSRRLSTWCSKLPSQTAA